MDGRWSDVGDDGDEDLLQIPVPAGCQNGVSGSESRFLMVAAQRSLYGKNAISLILLCLGVYVGERGRSRGLLGPPQARAARPGLGRTTCV
jgi:hypothetical protein